MPEPTKIKRRLLEVHERIAAAAERAGRRATEITLVAVSKTVDNERLLSAYAAGQRDFGENYVDELARKAADLPPDIRWHQIGPVQRRAAAKLPASLTLIHTLDRVELLERLARVRPGAWPGFLVQVNIGDEPQKSGVSPANVATFIDEVLKKFPDISLQGLMAIPPTTPTAEGARPYFAALREHSKYFAARIGKPARLSMGMSHDFEVAIAEGADIVRVGSAIFGERPT